MLHHVHVAARAHITVQESTAHRARSLKIAALTVLAHCFAVGSVTAQVTIGTTSFTDVAASGQLELGTIRGSIGVLDFDNDGWYDLFIPDYATLPDRLFRNVPDATKPGGRNFVDISLQAGINDPDTLAHGFGAVVAFDFNNDGFTDLFSAGNSTASSGLLHRNNGDGTFTNISIAAGVRQSGYFIDSASAIDFDHDGFTDLMLCPIVRSGQPIRLLRNNGKGQFVSRPDLLPTFTRGGHIYAHTWSDVDHDGWSDAVICLNAGTPLLLRNEADVSGNRRFIDASIASGFTTIGPAPMGIAPGDFDGDGDIDFSITDANSGTYFENRNGALVRIYPFRTFFGWGTTWLDTENDGDLDNYQAGSFSQGDVDFLYLNNGGGSWTVARDALNTSELASQQCARIDFDNDGLEDIITVNPDEFISVYHNRSSPANAWTAIRLSGRSGLNPVNADAVGGIVRIIAGGRTQTRELAIGTSYGSTEDPRAHFGLAGATSIDRIEVTWPQRGTLAERTEVFEGPFPIRELISLSPRPSCPADFNIDGGVDGADVSAFFSAWAAGAQEADTNVDGGVDGGDIEPFFEAWSNGGC